MVDGPEPQLPETAMSSSLYYDERITHPGRSNPSHTPSGTQDSHSFFYHKGLFTSVANAGSHQFFFPRFFVPSLQETAGSCLKIFGGGMENR